MKVIKAIVLFLFLSTAALGQYQKSSVDVNVYEMRNPFGGVTVKYHPKSNTNSNASFAEEIPMFSVEELVTMYDNPKNIGPVISGNEQWEQYDGYSMTDSISVYKFKSKPTATIGVSIMEELKPDGAYKLIEFSQMVHVSHSQLKNRKRQLVKSGWNLLETIVDEDRNRWEFFEKGAYGLIIITDPSNYTETINSLERSNKIISRLKK